MVSACPLDELVAKSALEACELLWLRRVTLECCIALGEVVVGHLSPSRQRSPARAAQVYAFFVGQPTRTNGHTTPTSPASAGRIHVCGVHFLRWISEAYASEQPAGRLELPESAPH